jgi:hypothetical protein
MRQTGGMFVYPLDDSYIHLAEAHTLAVDHIWGVRPGEFASASSSPIWTILLAAIERVVGFHLGTPIVLNLVFILGIFLVVEYGLRRIAPDTPLWARYLLNLTMILIAPMSNLIMLGMEHVAQTFSILALVILATEVLKADDGAAGQPILLCAVAALAGALRYEAAFAVLPVILLLLARRRGWLALAVGACAAMGPVGFGLYFHHVSGFWMPYSVIAKSQQAGGVLGSLRMQVTNIVSWKVGLPILFTLLPLWLLRLKARGFWEGSQVLLFLTLLISVIHILLGPVLHGLMRYDSYLFSLRLFALFTAFAAEVWQYGTRRESIAELPVQRKILAGITFAGLLLSVPVFGHRVQAGLLNPVQAAVDRYHEHIQMVRFIGTYYDHDTVVVNDIGALALFTHAHFLDVLGLASVEPLLPRAREGRSFGPEDVAAWAKSKNAPIALLSSGEATTARLIPKEWTVVQTWQLPRNVAYWSYFLTLYAVEPAAMPRLCASLKDFQLTPADKVIYDACPRGDAALPR